MKENMIAAIIAAVDAYIQEAEGEKDECQERNTEESGQDY